MYNGAVKQMKSSSTGTVSLLILAAITAVSVIATAIPTAAHAVEPPIQDCISVGGVGGGGGIGGTSSGNGGSGGTAAAGGLGGDGGIANAGPSGGSGGDGGSGGNSEGGDGGDLSAGNGGGGGDGGESRLTCVLVAPVLSVNPTIEVPSEAFEPRPQR
jgi:hypothetical protein